MIDSKVVENVKAAKAAKDAIELIDTLLAESDLTEDGIQRFWEKIQDATRVRLPIPDLPAAKKSMTDEEANRFSGHIMPFGQYKGQYIEAVPLRYLDWLVGESELFLAKLHRYLMNPRIQERLDQEAICGEFDDA